MSQYTYLASLFLSVCVAVPAVASSCPGSFDQAEQNELLTTGSTGGWNLVPATRPGLENLHRQGALAVFTGQTGPTCHYDMPVSSTSPSLSSPASSSSSPPPSSSGPSVTTSTTAAPRPLPRPPATSTAGTSSPASSSSPSSSSSSAASSSSSSSSSSEPSPKGILKAPGTPSSGKGVSFGGIDGTHTYPKGEHEFQTKTEKAAAESEVEAIRQSGVPVKKSQAELEAERNAQINADQERSKHDIMGDHAILPKQQAREARAEARRASQAEAAARQRELDRQNALNAQGPETSDADWE